MIKVKISEVKPTTSGWSKTLEFPGDQIAKGTNTVEWHAISADGHEVSNKFEFSVGKVTAKMLIPLILFMNNQAFGLVYLGTLQKVQLLF